MFWRHWPRQRSKDTGHLRRCGLEESRPHFYLEGDRLASTVAGRFRSEIDAIGKSLGSVAPDVADKPWREGGWTSKEIVGHLLDSASNNRQRFVRAAIAGAYVGPKYAQDA